MRRTRIGIGLRHLPDQEVVHLDAVLGENVEDAARIGGQRSVVEGQDDLMVLERQARLVLHRADVRRRLRIDVMVRLVPIASG